MFMWLLIRGIFENTWFPRRLRPSLLRAFGASIGNSVLIRNSVRIHRPWLITIGDNCWIGEGAWLISSERITIESNVCVSQKVTLCSGSHDFRSKSLQLIPKPILLRRGSWVCLGAYVLAGVTIGECSVVSAGAVARNSIPDYSIFIDGQIRPIDPPR
jgi:putative colanic acid biosynthesis acetyltransferase WcaF